MHVLYKEGRGIEHRGQGHDVDDVGGKNGGNVEGTRIHVESNMC